MKVLLISDHTYPAGAGHGVGKKVSARPSGSGQVLHDLLARGLVAEGHQVSYHLFGGAAESLPAGVELAAGLDVGADIVHTLDNLSAEWVAKIEASGLPWLATCHVDPALLGQRQEVPGDRVVFVSRTLARSFGRERFVHNGLDPAAYRYREESGDYLLFLSTLEWAEKKGLEIALRVAAETSWPLVVAGTASRRELIDEVDRRCAQAGATLVGDVRGERKAELLAGARALVFPTQVNEAFGLVMVEALLSGTPVICSDRGACPELIAADVGIVCREHADYLRATREVASISRARCREWALERYHYRRMVKGYVREYERELATVAGP